MMIALQGALLAQSITSTAKAEECFQLMSSLMTEGDSNATYDVEGTRITRTEKQGAGKYMEQFIHVDWASYRGLTTQERKDSLTATLNFNNQHVQYTEMSVFGYLFSRDVYKTSTIQFNIPSTLSNRLKEFGSAANRLAQIAKSGGNPSLKVAIPAGLMSAIPTQEESISNQEKFMEAISPWKVGITRSEDVFVLIVQQHDAEGRQLAAAAIPLDALESVKYVGDEFLFNGYIQLMESPEAEMEELDAVGIRFGGFESGKAPSWMLPFLKLHLWKYGAELEDGLKISIEGAALPKPSV